MDGSVPTKVACPRGSFCMHNISVCCHWFGNNKRFLMNPEMILSNVKLRQHFVFVIRHHQHQTLPWNFRIFGSHLNKMNKWVTCHFKCLEFENVKFKLFVFIENEQHILSGQQCKHFVQFNFWIYAWIEYVANYLVKGETVQQALRVPFWVRETKPHF